MMKNLTKTVYQYNPTLRIWTRDTVDRFAYSDGKEQEERLYGIVKDLKDPGLFSPEISARMTNWPNRYHLSAARANILRPFHDKLKGAKALELGSGCGGITRYLGEVCARVWTVEGSAARAAIGAARCRDLDNVRIHVDNIENFETDEKFDVVTLIGVLEYARVYIKAPDPTARLLEIARSFLKPDGVLVVAIENQLGLKYFCGAPEDHFGKVMYGINDSYDANSVVTFGREELQRRILASGFARCDLYTPFPDYKLPALVIYPEGLQSPPEDWDLTTLLAGTVHLDSQPIAKPLFSLRQAWGVLARNKLVGDLANSFLFAAYLDPAAAGAEPGVLAAYYRPERNRDDACEIQFVHGDDQLSVRTRAIGNSAAIDASGWQQSEYLKGGIWMDRLSAIVARPGWRLEQVTDWARPWVQALEPMAGREDWSGQYTGYKGYLPGHYYDATPSNYMVSATGEGRFFDLEWDLSKTIPIELVLLNGLMVAVERLAYWAAPGEAVPRGKLELVTRVMNECGYPVELEQLAALSTEIAELRSLFLGRGKFQATPGHIPFSDVKLPIPMSPGEETRSRQEAAAPKLSHEQLYQFWQASHVWRDREQTWLAERRAAWPTSPSFHLAILLPEDGIAGFSRTLGALAEQFLGEGWHISIIAATPCPFDLSQLPMLSWVEIGGRLPLQVVNETLLGSQADWLGMIEAGDLLAPQTFFSLSDAAVRHPEWRVIFTDEDSVDAGGNHSNPYFKPDFNLDLCRSAPYAIGGLTILHRGLFADLGGYRPDMEGVEYWDILLRAFEQVGDGGIGHIADILYHRYTEGGHCVRPVEEVLAMRKQALQDHFSRIGQHAILGDGLVPGTFHIFHKHNQQPLVSIIIPTKDQPAMIRRCVESIRDKTAYQNYEILLVDNDTTDIDARLFLREIEQEPRVRVLSYPHAYNFSAMNNLAAGEARGELLLLLNNDTAVLHEQWLDEMISHALRPDVGAVGARLLYPNSQVQHDGIILGLLGLPADHVYCGQDSEEPGYFGRAQLTQNFSAVTAACMLVRKDLYQSVGGLDEKNLKVAYNDVDFCLKLREKGYRVVWTPYASLLHEGSKSQREDVDGNKSRRLEMFLAESQYMFDKWPRQIAFDPAYNRNLCLNDRSVLIEISPALTLDPEWRPRPRILAHTADRMGCGEYRIIAPMRALNSAGRAQGWETGSYVGVPELFRLSPDSIVVQRQVSAEQLALLERYVRNSQAFRVFEIDDLITNVPIKNPRKSVFVANKDLHKHFRKGIGMCNRLVVSTEYLAEEYKGYTDEVMVVQNYMERAVWGDFKPLRRQGAKARVGWAGSVTHHGDLDLIIDVVKATVDEVDWVFFGMCPDELKPLIAEFHPAVKLEDYPAKLASLNLDLAVAPLEDVPFNHGKSHLRLLEYGVLGYPVVCTDITPYRGNYPVTRVPNKFKNWVDAIREHVADLDELARRGDALRDHIQANWMLEDNLDAWLKAWLPS
jgi:GT2 family glycosyltransferase/SAM-dependent methyltransferase/glycosyltransferase involved in cell wall biosynthesis